MRSISIDAALSDRKLFGAALGDLASWSVWRTILRATFGDSLDEQQKQVFAAVAGSRKPPARPVRELIAIAGRRSGKSRIAALVAAYIATCIDHRAKLVPGEVGYVLVLAASRAQATVVLRYIAAFLQSSAILRREVAEVTAEEIRLKSGIVIAVHPNSFKTVRGRSLVAAVFDETSYWPTDDSALSDVEALRAVLPSLSTTNGMLIAISSPYRKAGLMFTRHRDFYAKNDDEVLVVKGATTAFNPTIDTSVIRRAEADDREAAQSEWHAEFRSDLSALLDDQVIDGAIDHDRPLELPPRKSSILYQAYCDSAGGVGSDSYSLAITHQDKDLLVVDLVRGTAGKFDPQLVTEEYARLLKEYGIRKVVGDAYGAEWTAGAWSKCDIRYVRSELPKGQIYLECVPLFARGVVRLPDHARLLRELRLLERRTHRSGRDTVDHPRGAHDDHANAACGALQLLTTKGSYDSSMSWVGGPSEAEANAAERAAVSLWRHPIFQGGLYQYRR
jgi:hypothetical protein